MKVLAIVAHPDDESLFCGGTLAQHVEAGDTVRIVSMGTGVGARGSRSDDEVIARCQAFVRACAVLGADENLMFETFPDQQADAVPQIAINRAVADVLETYGSDLIYTHHVGDLNIDHRRVAEAVFVGTRLGPTVRCMSPEFPERCVGPAFAPNLRLTIWNRHLEKKVAACLCYGMELRPYPHPRSEQALRERRTEAFMEIR